MMERKEIKKTMGSTGWCLEQERQIPGDSAIMTNVNS